MSAHSQHDEDPTPQVQIERVDHLPDGRLVGRAEMPHETLILVCDGAEKDFPAFLTELRGVLQEGVSMWTRRRTG